MVKVYHTNDGIRATTGIWLFESMEDAKPTIKAYEEGKQKNEAKFDYVIEVTE